ncbi:hypothetical protein U1769_15030 [Sphingomonas sp. ZT3P38]|uniref:hypothetical protein n=1 Tax=Parasphingomonas zepuensis TaxID=3096161 RepID=UPI002FC5AC9A
MRHDDQWHRAGKRGRGGGRRDFRSGRRRWHWFKLCVTVAMGTVAGLAVAQGLNAADQSRYDRLLTGADLAPPRSAGIG